MWFMWIRSTSPRQVIGDRTAALADLGSQLEDLITHVMDCERWARFDDRLDLAFAVERLRPSPRPRRG